MSLPVMLFAAGRGTRMAPLTDRIPKPLVEVAGKPLIRHAVDVLPRDRLGPFVANTHYLPHALEEVLNTFGIPWIRERELLDTGGGLKNALPLLRGDPVLTQNTDCVWAGGDPCGQLLAAWDADRMDGLLLLVRRQHAIGHSGRGDFDIRPDGRILRGTGHVYTGMHILKVGQLAEIRETAFSLNVVWDMMARNNRLFGIVHEGGWCDVGRPESLSLAEALLRKVR